MVTIEKTGQIVKVINKMTGEVRETELKKVISYTVNDVGKFYQQYSNGVMAICGIKPDYCAKVYMYLCDKANSNEVFVTQKIRKDIEDTCGLKKSAIILALKILNDNGIINRIERGHYELNPIYSWNGTSKQRAELLKKAKVTFRIDIEPDEEIFEEIK